MDEMRTRTRAKRKVSVERCMLTVLRERDEEYD